MTLPLPPAAALAEIQVRPGQGLRLLLAADLTRSVAMALGALMVPRLALRSGPWWIEWAGATVGLPWGVGAGAVRWWYPWALGLLALLSAASTLGCFRLRPRAMSWRRLLGLAAVVEVLLPGIGGEPRAVLTTLWNGAVWVGLLLGGLALSREVARVTGEEGLEADPLHRRL